MKIKTERVQVYTFAELGAKARARVIDRAREAASEFFAEDIRDYFDAGSCWGMDAAALGVTFKTDTRTGVNPYTKQAWTHHEPRVYWELHRQGAGACFEGRWERPADPVAAMRAHAGDGDALHAIAADLATAPAGTTATIRHRGHYYHAGCTEIEVYDAEGDLAAPDVAVTVAAALRAYMTYVYNAINAEYDYRTSDEALIERIAANHDGDEYLADGRVYVPRGSAVQS